jgi:cold shock CspA family protein
MSEGKVKWFNESKGFRLCAGQTVFIRTNSQENSALITFYPLNIS